MSSIVTEVFKATIGLLVNKGRDKMAEILKEGDVTDQKFHSLIVREIDEIKSKLDALSKKDLEASISFFEEGIALLYEVFDEARSRGEHRTGTAQAAPVDETFFLAEGIRKLEFTGLDDSATRKLSNAKERFKEARRKATEAFKNAGLKTSDRILAMQYRVMATILETVDNPADAVAPCRVCIKELNCLPAVQNSFNAQLKTGIQAFRGLFGKEERREIISRVCHVNRTIFYVTVAVGKSAFCNWPIVDAGKQTVDPLSDERLTKVLGEEGMEPLQVTPWSFGEEGEGEHKLKFSTAIATNSSGQYIVADIWDGNLKVFDSNGKFVTYSNPSTDEDDENTESRFLYALDLATDLNGNIYVLPPKRLGTAQCVYQFTKTADLQNKFLLRGTDAWSGYGALSVSDNEKMVLLRYLDLLEYIVEQYKTDGQFIRSFGKGILRNACDITAANDGRVMVTQLEPRRVNIFSENGDHLIKFQLQRYDFRPSIAFHRASEQVVVAGAERDKGLLHLEIYTKDGQYVRSTEIHEEGIKFVKAIAVSTEGRTAVITWYCDSAKLLVL